MFKQKRTQRSAKREALLTSASPRFIRREVKETFNANVGRASAADRPTRARAKAKKR